MFIFIVPSWGGAIRAGYQQNELQERLFILFYFLIFSRLVVLSLSAT